MAAAYELFDVELGDDHVARVGINHPPRNLMNRALIFELDGIVRRLEDTPGIRALVLRSSIPGMFMPGADLAAGDDIWAELHDRHVTLMHLLLRLEALPFPTIAEIGGHALGGGCELTLACDFRVMARGRGRIGLPEIRHGLFPCGGGTTRVARLVGRAAATDLVLRGRLLDADEALAVGLVTDVCEEAELGDRCEALAAELAALAPLALAAAKRVIRESLEGNLADGLKNEGYEIWRLTKTDDVAEGLRAFAEKRPAAYVGR